MFAIGVSAVIFDARGRVLLCHRRDMDVWNLPGGVVESGELPTEAVVREAKEETGLEVSVEGWLESMARRAGTSWCSRSCAGWPEVS